MGVFKILSVLAFIALATTVNADAVCQANCFDECTKFVTEVANGLEDCQVTDSNSITDAKCYDHCEIVCFGTADGTGDCANDCAKGCGAWAKDLASDLDCTVDADGEAMENQSCTDHCNNVCKA